MAALSGTNTYYGNIESSGNKFSFGKLIIVGLIILAVLYFLSNADVYVAYIAIMRAEIAVDSGMTHAIEKHGAEASLVLECSNKQTPLQTWGKSDRTVAVLCLDNGKYALHIKNLNGDTITAFIKNKLSHLEQVAKYLSNSGYTLIK